MDLATVDKLLTTTRSVRKRLDLTRPIEPEVIVQCLDIATQAPTGGNICRYYFAVVTDPVKRQGVADLYRQVFSKRFSPSRLEDIRQRQPRDAASWEYLAEHLHEVPVHIITCVELQAPVHRENALTYMLPATWSLMLALRARGIGSAWTTLHTVYYAQEAATLLGIPEDIQQVVLLPLGRILSQPSEFLHANGRIGTHGDRPAEPPDLIPFVRLSFHVRQWQKFAEVFMMSRVEEIQSAIVSLSPEEYARLRQWFAERDWEQWDQEIERDAASGKLDFLIEEAVTEKNQEHLREL